MKALPVTLRKMQPYIQSINLIGRFSLVVQHPASAVSPRHRLFGGRSIAGSAGNAVSNGSIRRFEIVLKP
jgi:hypothetical protein